MTHELTPTIEVTSDHFRTALKHGVELWIDGSTPTKRLDQRNGRDGFTRFVNARAEGKMGEVAMSIFLEEYYGIESQVDWRIYGDYEQTDDGDLQYLVGDDGEHYKMDTELEIKQTKMYNSWLAVRSSVFRQYDEESPIVLVKLLLQDDLVMDEWQDADDWEEILHDEEFGRRFTDFANDHFPLDVKLAGSAYKHEFTDSFDQGDRLYDPETGNSLGGPLRMDNEGIHVDDLVATTDRWNRIVSEIVGDNSISYEEL